MVIQIVLVCFAVFMLSRVFLRFRRGGVSFLRMALWILLWSGVIVAAIYPNSTMALAHLVGVGRGADAVMYAGLLLLFYLLFRMFGKLEDLERQITKVVRAAALKDLDDEPVGRDLTPPSSRGS